MLVPQLKPRDLDSGMFTATELAEIEMPHISNLKDWRPPLANDLFSGERPFGEIIQKFSDVRPLVAELRRTNSAGALEDRLAEYQHGAEAVPARLRHLVAMRFYLREVIESCSDRMMSTNADAGITNYTHLAVGLYEWAVRNGEQVCVVNFNYDTLFEMACKDAWGFDRGTLSNFVTSHPISLLKPHGSVDWQRQYGPQKIFTGPSDEASVERFAQFAVEIAPHVPEMGPVEIYPHRRSRSAEGNTARLSIPALAPPIKDKTDFEWPEEHRDHFRELPPIDRLLTIGWRAADKHFLELLVKKFSGRALPTLIVTGGPHGREEAEQVATNLGLQLLDTRTHTMSKGFTPLMSGSPWTEWLSSG